MKKLGVELLKTLHSIKEAQPLSATEWANDVSIIEEPSKKGDGTTWWVQHDPEQPILGDEQLDFLASKSLAEHEAIPVKKRFGKLTQFAVGVKIEALTAEAGVSKVKPDGTALLSRKVKELEKQLRAAREDNIAEHATAEFFLHLEKLFKVPTKKPASRNSTKKPGKSRAGTPVLFLSDWHWGEVVDAAQVENLNSYDVDIARDRAGRVFQSSLDLLFHHMSGVSYDGIAVPIGGDMLSGLIHEELRSTNEISLGESLMSLAEVLAENLRELGDNFPFVFVPCVVGNHGRLDQKPVAKNAVKNNVDWILYEIVSRMVRGLNRDVCNIEFDIGKSLDLPFGIYNTNYILTHGDQFKTGTGSGNFWGGMLDNMQSKSGRSYKGGGLIYDYMLCGHFHKYGTANGVIVNGSLKGYDEYGYRQNMEYERPTQALWMTHPEMGITGHFPIFADPYISDAALDFPPISRGAELLNRR